MNGLEFVSSLVGYVLSWPVAAVVIAVVLRAPLGRLLDRVRRGKLWGGEFDLEESSKQADASADRAAKEVEQALAREQASRDATQSTPGESVTGLSSTTRASERAPEARVQRGAQVVINPQMSESSTSPDEMLDEAWTHLMAGVRNLYKRYYPDDDRMLLPASKKVRRLVDDGQLPESFMESWQELVRLNRARRGSAADALTLREFDRYMSAARELDTIVRRLYGIRFGPVAYKDAFGRSEKA